MSLSKRHKNTAKLGGFAKKRVGRGVVRHGQPGALLSKTGKNPQNAPRFGKIIEAKS